MFSLLLSIFSLCLWALLVSQVTAGPVKSALSTNNGTIIWGSCSGSDPPGLQCGNISVPLDYGKPDGERITLGLARFRSMNGTNPKGSLQFNPGGPGDSASEMVIGLARGNPLIGASTLAHYDIVGLDPRGVGLSSPVKCDASIFNQRISIAAAANSSASYEQLADHYRRLGQSCLEKTGALLNHLDTTNVVRDLDAVRAALGDDKLHYLGLSYGTQIGAQYAERFPERVGRMVLDGVLDHSVRGVNMLYPEAASYDITLGRFFGWCKAHPDRCAIAANGTDPASVYDKVIAAAEASPIPAPGCSSSSSSSRGGATNPTRLCRSDVTAEELISNLHVMIWGVERSFAFPGWSAMAEALAEAAAGNATALSSSLASSDDDWASFALVCIASQDWPGFRSQADVAQLLTTTGALAPRTRGFGSSLQLQSFRSGWPTNVTNPPHVLERAQIAKAPKILLVNALFDPATSLVWAENVRTQMPQGSPLILRNGSGHTSYLLMGQTSKAVDRFLVDGLLPADGSMYVS